MYVGFGYDIHRFKKNKPLILGGVIIKSNVGLDGHSDADVLIHAIMDALLGAAGLDDIGHFFPNTDSKYRNISSVCLLKFVYDELRNRRFCVNNIDSVVIAEIPKLYPFVEDMKQNISEIIKLKKIRIAIKATTNEGIGFVGGCNGIAAMSVASIISVNKE
jgi:2-C-methyl-D-erythritol 2,4-cyclodiphosphate synthase